MTVDDENSVYIGGLSYESTEDSLRKAFDFYGRVVAVKIVNDRTTGGKCYGFVTFTNPRSAVNAITDMDGKRLDGRVIKVSEVKSRIGRSNFGRDSNFRRSPERGMDWERGRDREKDYGRDRFHDRLREERSVGRDQDRERGNDRTRDQERERLNDRTRDRTRSRDHFVHRDRGRDQGRDTKDIDPEHAKNLDLDQDRDWNPDCNKKREFEETKSHHRSGEKYKDQLSKSVNGSEGNDHRSREPFSEPSDGDNNQYQGYAQLDISTDKLGELQKEILEMEELLEEKGEVISKLQGKSQDLEDALSMAKGLTSHHQLQLTKLHKCYLHMKDYSESLKTSEQELQSLVDSTMIEIEYDDNVGARNGVLENGNAQHFKLV